MVRERGEGDFFFPPGDVSIVADILVLEVSADCDLFDHQCGLDRHHADPGYHGAAAKLGRPIAVRGGYFAR